MHTFSPNREAEAMNLRPAWSTASSMTAVTKRNPALKSPVFGCQTLLEWKGFKIIFFPVFHILTHVHWAYLCISCASFVNFFPSNSVCLESEGQSKQCKWHLLTFTVTICMLRRGLTLFVLKSWSYIHWVPVSMLIWSEMHGSLGDLLSCPGGKWTYVIIELS